MSAMTATATHAPSPSSATTPEVECVFEGKTFPCGEYATLRSVMKLHGVNPHAYHTKLLNCRGFGLCGTCIVEIAEGMENLTPKTFLEKFWLDGAPPTFRLACQAQVLKGKVTVVTDPKVK